ncbi:MAG: hypothetical protein J6X55_10440 [Victivallales bacterium]|nr:hypothetical protein [Victivallales bacterium]
MKNDLLIPEFDEAILTPEGDEEVHPVYTLPLHEFRFQEFCNKNHIINYLPMKPMWKIENHRRNDKIYQYKRKVLRPMFASYVFVKMKKQRQHDLYISNSINRILPVSNQEGFLEDIRIVRKIELIGLSQELEYNCQIKEGDHFIIHSGVWDGISGWLQKKDKQFLWFVELEFNHEIVRAEIDPSQYKMTRLE